MDKRIDYSKIYSPSKLRMFEVCPKSYHFYYLDPIYSSMKKDLKKQPDNIFSFQTLGKAIHNAITLFLYCQEEEKTLNNLKKLLLPAWQSEVMWNKKPPLGQWGGFKNLEEEREIYREALLMLENFFKMNSLDLEIEYLPTKDFKKSISDYKNLIIPLDETTDISGKFDLITRNPDDSLNIIDFKTGKREDDNCFQLRFYKLLAESNLKKPVKKAYFYFLKKGIKKEFDLESEEAEKIKNEILAMVNKIRETKDFETRPGSLCQFCLFKSFCPKQEEIRRFIKEKEEYFDDLPF